MYTLETKNEQSNPLRGQNYSGLLALVPQNYAGVASWPEVQASVNYTLSSQPTDGQSLVIGTKTYVFRNAISADGDVKIGTTLADTQNNIVAAINSDINYAGSGYAVLTRPNSLVTMTAFSSNVAIIRARKAGTLGNAISVSATAGSVASATLTGGASKTPADIMLSPSEVDGNVSSMSSLNQSIYNYYNAVNTQYFAGILASSSSSSATSKMTSYTTGQIKKVSAPRNVGKVKSIAAVNLSSTLKEQLVTLGFNLTNISEVIPMSASTFLVYYAGSGVMHIVSIASDGTATVGATFTHANSIYRAASVSATKFVAVRYISASSFGVMYFSVSGTTISFVSETTVTGLTSVSSQYMAIEKVATDKAVVAITASTKQLYVADVSGSLTLGSAVVATLQSVDGVICSYDTDKFVYIQNGNIQAGVVTGTSIALGSAYSGLTVTPASRATVGAIAVTTSSVLYSSNGQNSQNGFSAVAEQIAISGTTITNTKYLYLKVSSGSTNGGRFYSIDASKIGFMTQTPSGVDTTMYQANVNYTFIIDVAAGVTSMNGRFRTTNLGVDFPSSLDFAYNRFAKTASFAIAFANVSATTGLLAVWSPESVSLYNRETLIKTATLDMPFAVNTVNVTDVSASDVYSDDLYIKIQNNDANTINIRIESIIVEML